MWTATLIKNNNGTYNAWAYFVVSEVGKDDKVTFTWNATIKNDESEILRFTEEAKKVYANHINEHKDDDSLKSQIEALLNS